MAAGPKELTCGVYKDVKLQLYRQKIKHVRVATKELSSDQLVATVLVEVEVAEPQPGSLLEVTIESSDGQVLSSKTLEASSPTVSTLFTVNHPALWWPVGHGKPVLHTAVTNLVSTVSSLFPPRVPYTKGRINYRPRRPSMLSKGRLRVSESAILN